MKFKCSSLALTIAFFLTTLLLSHKVLEAQDSPDSPENEEEEEMIDRDTLDLSRYKIIIEDGNIEVERKEEPKIRDRQDPLEVIDDIETRFLSLDIGVGSFTSDQSFTLPNEINAYDVDVVSSRNYRIHLYQQRINLLSQKLNLVHGLGLDYKRFSFSRPVSMHSPGDSTFVSELDEDQGFESSSFRKNDLILPVHLYYRSNPTDKSRSFNLMVGGHVGVVFRDEHRREGDKVDFRDQRDFNVNRFNYGVGVRVGFGRFNFYANYEITPVFKEDRGPELNVFNAGVRLWGIR